jgi:hypothetical protein
VTLGDAGAVTNDTLREILLRAGLANLQSALDVNDQGEARIWLRHGLHVADVILPADAPSESQVEAIERAARDLVARPTNSLAHLVDIVWGYLPEAHVSLTKYEDESSGTRLRVLVTTADGEELSMGAIKHVAVGVQGSTPAPLLVDVLTTSAAKASNTNATARQLELAAEVFPHLVLRNPLLPLLRVATPGLLAWL